jgi:V/A-type H+-transporting ATPase subunit E
METSGNLRDLVDRVLARAREEAAASLDHAHKVAERELETARKEGEARKAEAEARVARTLEARRQAALAEIALQERRAALEKQERAVAEVFGEALERLRRIESAPERRALLARLIGEGVRALGSPPAVRVALNAAERGLAAGGGVPARVAGAAVSVAAIETDTAGGPLVTDETGRMMYDNTFEARLERRRPELRALVAEMLDFAGRNS